jgi:phosphoglycerate dehydrogenase-like enzyme
MGEYVSRDMIAKAKKLKWIQHYAGGVEEILYPELVRSDITLTNCKIVQGPEVADHGFALLLALTRRLDKIIPDQKNQQERLEYYRQPANWPLELQDRTAVIIGMGGIGVQLAQRAHAFGMRVLGVDPKDLPLMLFVEANYKPDELHQVLPQADVVFLTAPLTPQTENMMGAEEFRLMKGGAYFIALSRGRTYSLDALVESLRDGRLAGAGLDVTDPPILPPSHPLWSFDNVIVTPHMAGQSAQGWERRLALLKANLQRFIDGRSLINVVNKEQGY